MCPSARAPLKSQYASQEATTIVAEADEQIRAAEETSLRHQITPRANPARVLVKWQGPVLASCDGESHEASYMWGAVAKYRVAFYV